MSDDQRQNLTQAVALSRAMLKAAQREQWEQFRELDQQRDKLFKTSLTRDIPDPLREFAIQSIHQMQALEARIMPLAEAGKATMQTSLAALQKGKKAAAFYTSE